MDYSNLALFQMMKARMAYFSQRQAVLAQNVANADTPGYHAKDIAKPDFKKLAASLGAGQMPNLRMAQTSGQHMMGSGSTSVEFNQINRKTTDEMNPDDNNVSIEEEMAQVAENQQEYQKAISLYSKTISLLNVAIGRPTGS